MTEPTSSSIPAAWYPDPAGGPRQRWWDGTQWTENYQEPYSGAGVALKAPEGIVLPQLWIWLIVALPLVSLIPMLTIDWTAIFASVMVDQPTVNSQLALFAQPGYLIAIVLSWPIYFACVLFAFFDWRALNRLGVPRPFHWAWTFLSSLVYVIGRSVIVMRRTGGKGRAPLWGAIGYVVVTIVVTIVLFAQVFNAAMAVVGYRIN